MTLSLNETNKLVKDAARGSGMPWGDADELARAAVWLEVAGLPGLVNAARAIDEHLNALASPPEREPSDPHCLGPRFAVGDGRINALAAGLYARDLIYGARDEDVQIRVKALFLPMIALGVIAPIAQTQSHKLNIELHDPNGSVTAHYSTDTNEVRVAVQTDLPPPPHPLVDMRISRTRSTDPSLNSDARTVWSPNIHCNALETGLTPDNQAVDTLRKLAHNCLVPATEESRLKGAGAGTIDRD